MMTVPPSSPPLRPLHTPSGTVDARHGLRRIAGLTLVECVISTLIIGVGLIAAINAVGAARLGESRLNDTRRADELALSLLAEITSQPFSDSSDSNASVGPTLAEAAGANRLLFNDVNDYAGFTESPPRAKDGSSLGLDLTWRRRASVRLVSGSNPKLAGTLNDGLATVTVIVSRNMVDIASHSTLVSAGLPATESCALNAGACENLVPAHCLALGGTPGGPGSNCWTTPEQDTDTTITPRVFYTRTAIRDMQTSTFDESTSQWSSTALSGSTGDHGGQCVRAAALDGSILVATARWDDQIFAGVCDENGVGTYASICADADGGLGDRRPVDVAAEGSSREGLIVYWDVASARTLSRTVSGGVISAPAPTGISSTAAKYVTLVSMGDSNDQIMALVVDISNRLHAALWDGSAWGSPTTLTTALNSASKDAVVPVLMDSSKSLMVVFSDTTSTRFGYRVFIPGFGWSAVAYRTGLDSTPLWVRATNVPGSDSIHAMISTSDGDYWTSRWSGLIWTTPTLIASTAGTGYRGFDITRSPDASEIMMIYRTGNTTMSFRTWDGSAWSSAKTAFTHSTGSIRTVLAKPGASGTFVLGIFGDSSAGANVWSWDGTKFGVRSRLGLTDAYMSDKDRFDIVGGAP